MLQIWLGRYDKAESLIRRGLLVPGMDTTYMKYNRAILLETQGNIERAAIQMIHLIQTAPHATAQEYLEHELERLKRKIALSRKGLALEFQ
jgi:hypothetical protein